MRALPTYVLVFSLASLLFGGVIAKIVPVCTGEASDFTSSPLNAELWKHDSLQSVCTSSSFSRRVNLGCVCHPVWKNVFCPDVRIRKLSPDKSQILGVERFYEACVTQCTCKSLRQRMKDQFEKVYSMGRKKGVKLLPPGLRSCIGDPAVAGNGRDPRLLPEGRTSTRYCPEDQSENPQAELPIELNRRVRVGPMDSIGTQFRNVWGDTSEIVPDNP